ncbi:MAG: hypothetical protein H8E78_07730 [Proteobacteria bacterium]|nr:hypothetical protein [Pseudomonadota bacterium]
MDEVARVDACDDGAAIDEGGQNGEAIAFAADFDANSRTFSASRSRQFPGFDLEHDAFFEIGDDFGHESREIVVAIESAARQVREFATREAVLRHGMQGGARPDHAVSKGAVDSAILFDEESNPAGCIDDACVHAEWLGFDPDRLAFEEDALGSREMVEEPRQRWAGSCIRRARGQCAFDGEVCRCRHEIRADPVAGRRRRQTAAKWRAHAIRFDGAVHVEVAGALFEFVHDASPAFALDRQALA